MIKVANYCSTTLAANVGAADLSMLVSTDPGFPSLGAGDWFYLVIVRNSDAAKEIVKVTAGTTTLTVERAQESTTALDFLVGDVVQLWVTAQTLNDLVAVPSIAMTVSGGALSKSVACQVNKTGNFIIRAWLVDGAAITDQQTLRPPDGSSVVQWEKITDAAGLATFTVTHTGSSQTWYMCAAVGGEVQISDAITMGT